MQTSRCWLEVDLDVVAGNYREARRICGDNTQIIPVLKANAYGLGAARLSQLLYGEGARLFAVAELHEALEVMAASGADALVLGMIAPDQMAAAIDAGAIATVYDRDQAERLSNAARHRGKTARVHIKLDTGLHRLGFDCEDLNGIRDVFGLPGLHVEGMYTHLALREPRGDEAQIARFRNVIDTFQGEGRDCGLIHALDSIGMVRYPDYHFDAVRIGAWLYGVVPNRYPNAHGECRLPVKFMARVAQVRNVPAGEYIGYDEDHPLTRDRRIATLSAGYADGYPRVNNIGEVEIHGRRAPIMGLLCMDQMMVDTSDIPDVTPGDPVTLLGDGISLQQLSAWTGHHRNELLCGIGQRVPRVYLGRGEL